MISIAIDGPTGAGKTTLAKQLARELNYVYVDTGALYRGLAYGAATQNVDLNNTDEVEKLLASSKLELKHSLQGEQLVYLNNKDVSEKLRDLEISEMASVISAIPMVRDWLLDLQREIADNNNVVMDGRDIGTVVLPNATVKIFITADEAERAGRRHKEYVAKGQKVEYNEVLEGLIKRDHRDMNRATAPLKKSDDAVLVNSTEMNFSETLELLLKIINDRIN